MPSEARILRPSQQGALSGAVKLDPGYAAVTLNRDVQTIKFGVNYKFESGVDAASDPSSDMKILLAKSEPSTHGT
jgi:hypothetical protein